jgi:hypothetical protein
LIETVKSFIKQEAEISGYPVKKASLKIIFAASVFPYKSYTLNL